MLPNTDDHDLLAIQTATRFVMTNDGRIRSENDPNQSAAPRFYLAGCRSGNVTRLRDDVGAETARAIEVLAADEPFLDDPDRAPVHLDDYRRILAAEAPIERQGPGLIWTFPSRLTYRHPAPLVGSETSEGDRLVARLMERGMTAALIGLGFAGIEDLWAPWCVALHDGAIASIAFTARLGPAGAETGVVTVPAWRGQGYAAAATAGWAALPALRGRPLFYSTLRTNRSSRRVAQRLGLRFLGASLSIS